MPRFRKGTTDHDNDGRMGGSLKGDTMVKKPMRSTAAKTTAACTRKSASQREQDAAIKADALAMTAAPDPQSGMSVTHPEDAPTPKQIKASRKAALDEQFGAADEKAREAIRDATMSRAVRGW